MKDLRKEKVFMDNTQTTTKEIRDIADRLLSLTWTVDIYRSREPFVINLQKKGWTFEYNTRKRAAGLCNAAKKKIYISKWLLEQNLHKSAEFENTVRHELAHALDFEMRGTSDHSRVWKAIAKKVLCSAERCYTADQIATTKTTKYTLICDSCGKEKASHKVVKVARACGTCCKSKNFGRFSSEYIIRQVKNY